MNHIGRACALVAFTTALQGCADIDEYGTIEEFGEAEQGLGSERVVRLALDGKADLNLNFSEFFGSMFTLSGWFQPEFVLGYTGPIFAVNGTGRFRVAMATPSDGNPRLQLQIGNKTVHYLTPSVAARTWHHVAVRRSLLTFPTGEYHYELYLNGVRQTPTDGPEITFSSTDPMTNIPTGNLRIGRGTDVSSGDASRYQFYGLVDEVAVYRSNEFGSPSPATLASTRAVNEHSSLIKGFTFDYVVETNPKLQASTTFWAPAESLEPPLFGSIFDLPSKVSPTLGTYQLPFHPDKAWQVVQGVSDTTSHYGEDAFCWDFMKVGGGAQDDPIYAAAAGDVILIDDSPDDRGTPDPSGTNYNQPWKIWTHVTGMEMVSYKHMRKHSIENVLCSGNCTSHPLLDGVEFSVSAGQQLGNLGTSEPVSNSHLHFCLTSLASTPGVNSVTMPMAFSNYKLCELEPGESVSTVDDLSQCTWTTVTRGMPRSGQIIKR